MNIPILTNQTTNQEFLDFIHNDIHNVVVSSITAEGKPTAQVCDILLVKNMKLYMTTSVNNPFFKALVHENNVIVSGYKGNGTMDSCGFSLQGTIKNVDHEYLEEAFKENPYLNEIYKDNLDQAKKELRILEITPQTAGYLDHRTNPIFSRHFNF